MIQIGLLSDTHGFIDERLYTFFENCDEIWHAGDIGNIETAHKLEAFKPFKAVYGNIDNYELRQSYQRILRFRCEKVDVLIIHIGGYPGNYVEEIKNIAHTESPKLVICGHSHILKVINDPIYHHLHMNPGSAGNSGFHQVKTAIRFAIDGTDIKNLDVWEAKR